MLIAVTEMTGITIIEMNIAIMIIPVIRPAFVFIVPYLCFPLIAYFHHVSAYLSIFFLTKIEFLKNILWTADSIWIADSLSVVRKPDFNYSRVLTMKSKHCRTTIR
jgi:hypothetical protein